MRNHIFSFRSSTTAPPWSIHERQRQWALWRNRSGPHRWDPRDWDPAWDDGIPKPVEAQNFHWKGWKGRLFGFWMILDDIGFICGKISKIISKFHGAVLQLGQTPSSQHWHSLRRTWPKGRQRHARAKCFFNCHDKSHHYKTDVII